MLLHFKSYKMPEIKLVRIRIRSWNNSHNWSTAANNKLQNLSSTPPGIYALIVLVLALRYLYAHLVFDVLHIFYSYLLCRPTAEIFLAISFACLYKRSSQLARCYITFFIYWKWCQFHPDTIISLHLYVRELMYILTGNANISSLQFVYYNHFLLMSRYHYHITE